MNENECGFIAAHIYRRLRSGDLTGAENLLVSRDIEELPIICGHINLNLGHNNLEAKGSIYATKASDMIDIFMDIYQSVVYNHELFQQIGELKTYPEYQQFMVDMGKDPLTFHEWEEQVFKSER